MFAGSDNTDLRMVSNRNPDSILNCTRGLQRVAPTQPGKTDPKGARLVGASQPNRERFMVSAVGLLRRGRFWLQRAAAVLSIILNICFFVGLAGISSARADSFAGRISKGNQAYMKGDYKKALEEYRQAQIDRPESERLAYNLGNALYKQNFYEEALQKFEKALGKLTATEQANAYFNLGNTLYRMNKLPEAIQAYQKTLEINPNDEDAKYNIEFVRKKIKEQPDRQAQKEKKQAPKTGKQPEPQPDSGNQQKAQQPKSESVREEATPPKQTDQRPGQKAQPQQMSKEDALRILNALKNQELDNPRKMQQRPVAGKKADKDW